jgi:hypothetical protein
VAAIPASRSARLQLIVGIIVIVILPLVSWLDGSGQLAWTMFSRTGQYRLVLLADGKPINATELAARAAPGPTAMALAGADHMKHHDAMRATLRRHLGDIAQLACRLGRGREIVARLEERVRTTEAIRTSEVTVRCE